MASITENIRIQDEHGQDAYRLEVTRTGDKATVRIYQEQITLRPPEVTVEELSAGMELVVGESP